MSKQVKYTAIESTLRRYRGEDAPAGTVTCPGCGLAFTPEQKAEQPAPAARSRRLPALESLRAVASPESDSLNEFQRKKREASDKAHESLKQEDAELTRRARAHVPKRGTAAKARSIRDLAASYYAPDAAGDDAAITTTNRGGK